MKINVTKHTDMEIFNKACAYTLGKDIVNAEHLYPTLLRAGHSPVRTQMFCVEMIGLPSFVSVHNVRHKIWVEHFVQSLRDDNIRVQTIETPDRNTPVRHMMFLNAESLINMARKRLCGRAHKETVSVMQAIRTAILDVDEELGKKMVPECVYRGGRCPEEQKTCGKVRQMWVHYDGEGYWKGCPSI